MRRRKEEGPDALAPNPLWYKEAVIYEIHVRAFADSNDDGIGDFNGLVDKLDYLQDLGVTALWLLPFYPSPLRDGGYDIADYMTINPAYGTLKDFSRLLKEAHRRGIRVITELVLNHTSSEHEWFQRSRRAPPGGKWRDYYVWSDSPKRYSDARIIFKDFETSNWTWDPVAQSYYWHRFYSHQPDLNFDNPEVHKSLLKVIDFWLELGVDGMRLDAVPYLYERDGTNCENLPETHAFLKQIRRHVDARFRDRMLLAEANQWPEDAAAYFGGGDECHMNFHFPLMPRMFMAVHLEDRFPIVDILRQTPSIPQNCQWATFLRNHDELTLEMVTDEDRDYMYRVYAEDPNARINLGIRRRLAPLAKGRRKIELMNAMLMSLPGTPVLYYGDEIGMGDNIYLGDRDGVRTPMQWSADRNAGFSRANPQKLYLPVITDPEYHYESNNVQAQEANASSLLWWMKRLIALRKEYEVFGTGNIEFLYPDNNKILAFTRSDGRRRVLVVINLSRFAQCAEIDLSRYAGQSPVEMFGRTPFPAIVDKPYFLSLGPHSFYWFTLEMQAERRLDVRREPPGLETDGPWTRIFTERGRTLMANGLLDYAVGRRWFRGKARPRKGGRIADVVPLAGPKGLSQLVLLEVDYVEGDSELYVVPLSFISGDEAERVEHEAPGAVVARLRVRAEGGVLDGLLVDGIAHDTPSRLIESIQKRTTLMGEKGQLAAMTLRAFKEVAGKDPLVPRPSQFEQTNSSVLLGDKMLLKIYRQIESGPNPELELGRFFTDRGATNLPRMLAAIEYRRPNDTESATLATVQELVRNEGVAWSSAMSSIRSLLRAGPARAHDAAGAAALAGGDALAAGGAGAAGAAARAARRLHRPRAPVGQAHRRHAPLAGVGARRSGVLAPAVQQLLSAVAVPGGAQDVGAHRRDPAQEAVVVRRAAAEHGPRHRRRRDAHRCASARHHRAQARARSHPRARRPAPRAGARHRQRLRHHRLRGRARTQALRAPLQALPAGRRGRHDALVPLRLRVGAALRTPAHRGRAGAPALGAGVDRVGARRLRRRVPEGHRQRALRARRRSREGADARLLSAREMYLRDPIRAE